MTCLGWEKEKQNLTVGRNKNLVHGLHNNCRVQTGSLSGHGGLRYYQKNNIQLTTDNWLNVLMCRSGAALGSQLHFTAKEVIKMLFLSVALAPVVCWLSGSFASQASYCINIGLFYSRKLGLRVI